MTGPGIPAAVARALRQIKVHERVYGVAVLDAQEATVVEVLIDSNLPSRWRADGASPNGIRAVEPVRFEFRGYPVVAPKTYLRPDFDRRHPHIQPGRPNSLPEPCILMGSLDELLRTRGIQGFVEQLALWLERAALVELIDPKQGWEPMRRDHIDDVVVVEAAYLEKFPDKSGGAITLETKHARHQNGTMYIAVYPAPTKLDKDLTQRLNDDTSIAIVAWSGKNHAGQMFVADCYEPEDVCDVASLIAKARRLGCAEFLVSKLGLLAQRLSSFSTKKSLPLAVVLIARRPCNLIGKNSPFEICPYIIDLKDNPLDFSEASSQHVRIASHRNTISRELLFRASGLNTLNTCTSWTLIGCGSVGSKLALHAARSGSAPDIVVDKSFMSPHNYARHGSAPTTFGETAVAFSKAELISVTIEAFSQRSAYFRWNISAMLSQDPRISIDKLLPGADRIIVNATGSIAVRESLCLPDVMPNRGRVVEANLIGGDRLACISIEGPNANPSTMDLAVETHKILLDEPSCRDLAFDPAVELITIGQGCSSLTFPMTDARLSALTAPMAERLIEWLTVAPPAAEGEIFIGITQADGMGQTWLRRRIEPWISIHDDTGCEIRISSTAHCKVVAEVAAKPGVETGGVLLGRWSDVANAFFVIDVIPAPPDSILSKGEFRLGVEGLRGVIDDVVIKTRGALHDIGTWHSHLMDSGPSKIDRKTADVLADGQSFPALMLIRTPNGYRTLIKEAGFENAAAASTDTE